MNTDIQVRRRRKSGLIEVIDRSPSAIEQRPESEYVVDRRGLLIPASTGIEGSERVQGGRTALYTRLWMAIAPPENGDPGYACVLGEVHNGKWRMTERPLVLLDEVAEVMLPRLFRGAAALKDTYWSDQIYADPRNLSFVGDMQRPRWGLCSYDSDLQEHELRELHPTYVSTDRIAAPVEPPYLPDDDWGRVLISALFGEKLLTAHPCCTIFATEALSTPHKALTLACMAMQAWDWSGHLEEVADLDGYDDDEMDDAEYAALREMQRQVDNLVYMVSSDSQRTEMDRREGAMYEDAPTSLHDRPHGQLMAEDIACLV